jgi:transposase
MKLQQKIAILEKQLQWEKMRVFALDTMIDIAEKQLDISIRKKSGSQQSREVKKANPITR